MAGANGQDWANLLWSIATMSEAAVDAGRHQLAEYFQHRGCMLLGKCAQEPAAMRGATPQAWANTLWAAAKLGSVLEGAQLLAQLLKNLPLLAEATPQTWSNTVWGIATLYEATAEGGNMQLAKELQGYGQLLLARCLQAAGAMTRAKPQEWSNTVWAAAKLGCLREGGQLLVQLAGNVRSMAGAKPQEWANCVWAAATLYRGHRGRYAAPQQAGGWGCRLLTIRSVTQLGQGQGQEAVSREVVTRVVQGMRTCSKAGYLVRQVAVV
jgi:hypothetical protein